MDNNTTQRKKYVSLVGTQRFVLEYGMSGRPHRILSPVSITLNKECAPDIWVDYQVLRDLQGHRDLKAHKALKGFKAHKD
ncbi:hypothetical protein PCCS19_54160 [Paenibacillus sp. CCS19]|nr:hypothetical protein PCCS19_54160 [Paenibacillus cellulosilyticus]